jgi:hypothetical protein
MLDPAFQNARDFLSQYLPQTRLVLGGSPSDSSDQNVYLKLENELPTGRSKFVAHYTHWGCKCSEGT